MMPIMHWIALKRSVLLESTSPTLLFSKSHPAQCYSSELFMLLFSSGIDNRGSGTGELHLELTCMLSTLTIFT